MVISLLRYPYGQAAALFLLAYVLPNSIQMWRIISFGIGLCHLSYKYYRSLHIPYQGRAVLVTGCDTGFGHSLAKKLHDMGLIVFACCLSTSSDGAVTLKKTAKETDRMHVIRMDVTNQKDVDEARRYVQDHLPKEGLWGVVNNAGFARSGYLEWVPMEDFEKVLAINLYGTIRVTKAFLPLIRQTRGRIVNVSSILSRAVQSFCGPYCISKCGVEAFTDVLRLEMRQFNVKVVAIQPGNFIGATNIISTENDFASLANKLWERLDDSLRQDYGTESLSRGIRFQEYLKVWSTKDRGFVVDAMTDALLRRYPKSCYFQATAFDKVYARAIQLFPFFITNALRNISEFIVDRVIWKGSCTDCSNDGLFLLKHSS